MNNPFEHLDNRLQQIEELQYILLGELKKLQSPEKDYLNIDEASKLLSLSKKTLHNFTSQGKIPHFKKGNRLYFERTKLLEWLTSERDMFKIKTPTKRVGANG